MRMQQSNITSTRWISL